MIPILRKTILKNDPNPTINTIYQNLTRYINRFVSTVNFALFSQNPTNKLNLYTVTWIREVEWSSSRYEQIYFNLCPLLYFFRRLRFSTLAHAVTHTLVDRFTNSILAVFQAMLISLRTAFLLLHFLRGKGFTLIVVRVLLLLFQFSQSFDLFADFLFGSSRDDLSLKVISMISFIDFLVIEVVNLPL